MFKFFSFILYLNISGVSTGNAIFALGGVNVIHPFFTPPWSSNPAFYFDSALVGFSSSLNMGELNLNDSFSEKDLKLKTTQFPGGSFWFSLPVMKMMSFGMTLEREISSIPESFNKYFLEPSISPLLTSNFYSDETISLYSGFAFPLLKVMNAGFSLGLLRNNYEEKTAYLYTNNISEILETNIVRKEEYIFSFIAGFYFHAMRWRAGFFLKTNLPLFSSDVLLHAKSTRDIFSRTSYTRDYSENKKKDSPDFESGMGGSVDFNNVALSLQGKLIFSSEKYLMIKYDPDTAYSVEMDCFLKYGDGMQTGLSLFLISPLLKNPLSSIYYTLSQSFKGFSLIHSVVKKGNFLTYNLLLTFAFIDGTFSSPANPAGDVDGYIILFTLHGAFFPS